jgi:hypothetical protein
MLKHHKRHYLADSFPATRRPRLRKYSRILFKVAYGGFAVIGLGFTAVFIAMQFGFLTTYQKPALPQPP